MLMEEAGRISSLVIHAFTTPPSILIQNCSFLASSQTMFLASCKILTASCHRECCPASKRPELLRVSDAEAPEDTAISIVRYSTVVANKTAKDLALQPDNPRYLTRHQVRTLEEKCGGEKEAEAEDSDDWVDEETSDLEKAGAGGKASSSRVAARDEGSDDEDVDIIPFDDEMDNILPDEPELEMDGLQDDLDLASEAEASELIDEDARDVEELDHLTLEEANMPPSPSSPQSNEKENIPPSPKGPQSPPRISAKVKGKGKVDSRSSPVRQNVVAPPLSPKRKRSEPADNNPTTKK
ncbi:hypothetical protein B0H13DRAFT_2305659 [Mycena leptocephala]|nr:hypothetical protein B0H13DRAFT_2305659 [Mycena leptocephala]